VTGIRKKQGTLRCLRTSFWFLHYDAVDATMKLGLAIEILPGLKIGPVVDKKTNQVQVSKRGSVMKWGILTKVSLDGVVALRKKFSGSFKIALSCVARSRSRA
jgi:hypothetical protein